MTQAPIAPTSSPERIQTIDIIRGFALFGILIVNFTVDNGDMSPMNGWTGFGDQLAYWNVRFFLDDRFKTIYCFLFGLGFAILMFRAEARNSPFVFTFLRRLIVLFLIGAFQFIITGQGIRVLTDYAIVGVLLLFFWKVPLKFLPVLAIFFTLLPWTKNAINLVKEEKLFKSKIVKLDNSILDKYTGVYLVNYSVPVVPERCVIVTREGNALHGEFPRGKGRWYPQSDTEFIVRNSNIRFSFFQDSSGNNNNFIMHVPGKQFPGIRVDMSIEEAKTKSAEQRKILNSVVPDVPDGPDYIQFIKNNATSFRDKFKYWSWKDFLWGGYHVGYILVLFLLGLYAGRRKIFYDIPANYNFIRKVMICSFVLGIICISISIGKEAFDYLSDKNRTLVFGLSASLLELSWSFGKIFVALAYIAGITLLVETKTWKKRLAFLATIGRMGLTNYILHAIAYIIIFEDFGLDLYGKTGGLYRIVLAIPVFVLLYLLSRWWLQHFRFGPVEWLWRSLTYLKFQPMRLKDSNNKI